MSIRYKLIATLTIVLTLVVGCGKSEPTTTDTPLPPPPTQTSVPPTNTPLPPAATLAPPTATPVPPAATQTPIPPTAEPSPTAIPATEPDVTGDTWFKIYGARQNDVANGVLLADDGGYFIVGVTNLEYEPERRGDVYLIRTNAAGDILWEKTYGGEGYEAGATAFQTSDGGLIISGATNSLGAGGIDIYLIKVDQDGNELWSKTFGGPLDEVGAAWPMDDGGYMLGGNIVDPNDPVVDNPGVAGYAGFAGRSNVYLARTDSDGNVLWSRTFGGENNVLASGAVQTPDGGFVILATIMYFPDNDDDIYLLKVDENGDEVWSRTWERGMSSGYGLVQTSDGNYLVTGPYSSPDDMDRSIRDFLFVKFDAEGNEIWSSTFGDPDIIDYAQVLAATKDGGYVAAGWAVRDLITWDEDIVIVKTDESGQLLWEQIVETDAHSMFGNVLQHPDGGYVIAGSIFNGRNFDIFLIKTDSQGNLTATSEPAAAAPALAVSFEQSAQTFPSVPTFQIGLGDLDGDGDLDAVFANGQSNFSRVWLNDGNGHFADTGQQLTQQGHGVDVGDLDGDGDLDLFLTCHGLGGSGSGKPSKVYLNDGSAVFHDSGQDVGDTDLSGNAVDLADIDGDGDLDAMIRYYQHSNGVYLNDGEGRFTASDMTFPDDSVWGDLDSDGDVDVFYKQDGVGYESMLNDGMGNFVQRWVHKDSTAMTYGDMALGDVDNDGDLDAVVTNGDRRFTAHPALVFQNDGAGQFVDSGQRLSAVNNAGVSLGDLNGDRYLDLVLTDFEKPNQIWINDGAGQFIDSGFRFGDGQFFRHSSLGDLDQDGDLDIFLATFGIDRGPNEIWFNKIESTETEE
jgi:hypothetical protein